MTLVHFSLIVSLDFGFSTFSSVDNSSLGVWQCSKVVCLSMASLRPSLHCIHVELELMSPILRMALCGNSLKRHKC